MAEKTENLIEFDLGASIDEAANAKRRNWRRHLWRELRNEQVDSVFEDLAPRKDDEDESVDDG